jgi:hypothetical protein
MSVSSTIFIHLITSPYVVRLKEITSGGSNDRLFTITTVNLFGLEGDTDVAVSQVGERGMNPFSSFCAGGRSFYVFGGQIEDKEVRTKFTREKCVVEEPVEKQARKQVETTAK